jgi:hypothetical protein
MHNGAIMSSEVRHLVDEDRPYPLVRLAGLLDASTARAVRHALLDVLADQPEAVVVDVSDLDVANGAAATLQDVRRDTAAWPAAHLVLCDTKDGARWGETGWPVRTTSARAFAELAAPHLDQRVSLTLEPQVSAARRSRELITETCGRWGRPELAGSACIVVTELVNNVVTHARTPMTVLLAVHDEGMSVAVRDEAATAPTFSGAPVAPTAYGGRGMLLIDSVASSWGCLALAQGKVVWALMGGEPAAAETAGRSRGAGMTGPDRG